MMTNDSFDSVIRTLRSIFRDRTTDIREFPLVANWEGGLFLQANAFFRRTHLWIGALYDRADAALYLCILGFGLKLKTIYWERIR